MTHDRVAALCAECEMLLETCHGLTDRQWATPSRAQGWSVQDMVAHMGAGCRAIFTLDALKILRSNDIEKSNDMLVDQRRRRTPAQVLGEYERWSRRLIRLARVVDAGPLARIRLPLAELGQFPVNLVLCSAMTFDHYTHLRHDIAPALGLPPPPSEANTVAVVLEWMLAVLANQLKAAVHPWLEAPLRINLTGPGGGSWTVQPDGAVTTQPGAAAAEITASALEFPEWSTRRVDWRQRDVTVSGDTGYGERFLDAVNIV